MQDRRFFSFASVLSVSLGFLTSVPANAWTPIAPGSETAIDVLTADNKPCDEIGSGIAPSSITGVSSITSEVVTNFEKGKKVKGVTGIDISSCLAFDKTTTASTVGSALLGSPDAGTNDFSGGTWYRPIARHNDGHLEEGGSLEVGTFTFDLVDSYSSRGGKLLFRFLDIEDSWQTTGVTIAGQFYRALDKKGANNNIAELILDMADVFTVSVGKDAKGTGDGVNFQIFAKYNEPPVETSVPEPSVVLGLGAAMAGVLKVRRRKG